LISLETPKVMGILNITPDSFYAGSRIMTAHEALKKAEEMIREGATFIDVGGYSSRPGATDISIDEELSRVMPCIKAIAKEFTEVVIVIDTFRSEVAKAAVDAGAGMINDISGGNLDEKMLKTVSEFGVPYIMMHMKGSPQTMSQLASYQDLLKEVIDYFHSNIYRALQYGIKDIIIDPGFGFAKTREHNFELLQQLQLLKAIGRPMLTGLSRKSMVWKTLDIKPDEALNGTTSLNTVALMKGADILRVHDVREAIQVVKLMQSLKPSLA
jgi:dihydropteroate synthase